MIELFKLEPVEQDNSLLAEKVFIYCLLWGVCGTFDTENRKKISQN